ncbi:hypothetical protein Tco_0750245 [Tanacetum coccineum]|uniref:Uncharacterized protein n=1 Tax=Tanacetum coccineum TaxID=301880 RepID=A0ABQ4Z0P3_9ASTR
MEYVYGLLKWVEKYPNLSVIRNVVLDKFKQDEVIWRSHNGKDLFLFLNYFKLKGLGIPCFGLHPLFVSESEENLRDPIDIRVDIIHPEPVAAVAFPAAAIMRTQAQHEEAIRGIQEHLIGVPIQVTALRFRETYCYVARK